MNRELSLYLDAARFTAAIAVVLSHLDEAWVPGLFPFFRHLGIEAVGVFFVLSGFVIAYVCDGREPVWQVYSALASAFLVSRYTEQRKREWRQAITFCVQYSRSMIA